MVFGEGLLTGEIVDTLEGGNRLGGCRMLQLAGCAAEPVSGILLIGLGMVWLFW